METQVKVIKTNNGFTPSKYRRKNKYFDQWRYWLQQQTIKINNWNI